MIASVPVVLSIVGAGLAAAWYWRGRHREANSDIVDVPETEIGPDDIAGWDDTDEIAVRYYGIPYCYGKGTPATTDAEAADGLDCSGALQFFLVRLGILSPDYPDRGSAQLAADADPIAWGSQQPGDFAVYPGHVMLVISAPDDQGDSAVFGASGGTEITKGDDPEAFVRGYSSALYRDDFVTFARLKDGKR